MAITDLWHATRSRRYAQRPNKLREGLGPQLLATRRHRLSLLDGGPSQSQWPSLSVSVTLYVQFWVILNVVDEVKKKLQKWKNAKKFMLKKKYSSSREKKCLKSNLKASFDQHWETIWKVLQNNKRKRKTHKEKCSERERKKVPGSESEKNRARECLLEKSHRKAAAGNVQTPNVHNTITTGIFIV